VIYKIYYVCGIGRKSLKYIRQREIAEAFYEVCIEEELENASISISSHQTKYQSELDYPLF
jgi:hypothetical protein